MLTPIQQVFSLSKAAAGADNHQEMLPNNGWRWPDSTWLKRRLEELRNKEAGDDRTD